MCLVLDTVPIGFFVGWKAIIYRLIDSILFKNCWRISDKKTAAKALIHRDFILFILYNIFKVFYSGKPWKTVVQPHVSWSNFLKWNIFDRFNSWAETISESCRSCILQKITQVHELGTANLQGCVLLGTSTRHIRKSFPLIFYGDTAKELNDALINDANSKV